MACNFGDTSHHFLFAVLQAAVLGCFLRTTSRVPPILQGAVFVGITTSVSYHAWLGAVCSTPLAKSLHALWDTHPLLRVRLLHDSLYGFTMWYLVAMYFVRNRKCNRAERLTKSATLTAALVLSNGLLLYRTRTRADVLNICMHVPTLRMPVRISPYTCLFRMSIHDRK